ncbi:hypothetical protein [Streptomyces sp. LN785]|uniref:hypothetical protein n=1 Tax=Streptomyces sp. LN785 TaxID=3112983 RepID=UPI00371A8E28
MTDSLSEGDILDAVARCAGRHGRGARPPAEGAEVSRLQMLDLTVDRSIETRTTRQVRRGGRPDLSHLTVYEGDLGDCPVEPPADPARPKTVEFVLRGSVRKVSCTCTGGRTPCERCSTRGTLRCTEGSPCPDCAGVDPCTWCDGTGKRRTGAPAAARSGPARPRVTCAECRKPGTACPGCRGKGVKKCTKCNGTGAVPCPSCDGEGSTRHDGCDGTGTLTLYTGGFVTYTAHRTSLTLPEPRPPRRVRHRTRGAAWERVTLKKAGAALPDGLDPSHHKAVGAALAPRPDEVSRRAELGWLPLAQVVLADDPDHVFYVFPGRDGPEACSVWSRRRVLRAAWSAAAAAVLLVLVLALIG